MNHELLDKLRRPLTKQAMEFITRKVGKDYLLQKIENDWILDELREIQREAIETSGRPLPMIAVFNHIEREVVWVVNAMLYVLEGSTNKLFLPVAEQYTHIRNNPSYWFLVQVGRLGGCFMPPIVQSYRLQDEGLTEKGRQELEKLSRELVLNLRRALPQRFKAGDTLIISPEGHRTEDDFSLQPAEEGVGSAVLRLRKLEENGQIPHALIIPFGIKPLDQPGESIPHPREFDMIVEEPLTPNELFEKARLLSQEYDLPWAKEKDRRSLLPHALMMEVRDLLPSYMHGVYDPNHPLFIETLRGNVHLRINKEGHIKPMRL